MPPNIEMLAKPIPPKDHPDYLAYCENEKRRKKMIKKAYKKRRQRVILIINVVGIIGSLLAICGLITDNTRYIITGYSLALVMLYLNHIKIWK